MERNTRQRNAIRVAFESSPRPLAIEEVLKEAQAQVPGMGIATVYRNIKSLVDTGWLVPVELPGEPPRYEASGKSHHHYFRCDDCNRVFDLVGCVDGLNALGLETFEPRGAFYAFPRIGSTGLTDDEFTERLLTEEHVAVVPGSAFGPSGVGHVRMCYATSDERLEEALRRIGRFVERARAEIGSAMPA